MAAGRAPMSVTANQFFSAPAVVSQEIEDRFFTDLKTGNATFKRTAGDRFRELDDICFRCFAAAGATIGEALDIGISSGSTTLALSERLLAAGHGGMVIGTDLSFSAHLVPVAAGVRTLVDEAGLPLQHDVLGMVVRPWRRRLDYFTGMVAVRGLLNRLCGARAQRRLQAGHPGIRPVQLVSPRLRDHPRVRVEKNDIFTATPRYQARFDFVRAANILNRGYFSEAEIRRALVHVVSYLSGPGAWLLIARSTGGQHVATLFQVSADGRRLQAVDRFGGGSEIEWLVFATPLPMHWGA
jgi:hypothetical protein